MQLLARFNIEYSPKPTQTQFPWLGSKPIQNLSIHTTMSCEGQLIQALTSVKLIESKLYKCEVNAKTKCSRNSHATVILMCPSSVLHGGAVYVI